MRLNPIVVVGIAQRESAVIVETTLKLIVILIAIIRDCLFTYNYNWTVIIITYRFKFGI